MCHLPSLLKWAGENATLLGVVVATIGVVITGFYAYLTARLLHETIELRKVETEPNIVIYLEPSLQTRAWANMVVGNVGNGAAYAVTFRVKSDLTVDHGNSELGTPRLGDLPLFKNGAALIAPHQSIRFYIGNWVYLMNKQKESGPITIDVSYYNKHQHDKGLRHRRRGKPYREAFAIEALQFWGLDSGATNHEDLRSIERTLTDIGGMLASSFYQQRKTYETQTQRVGIWAILSDKLRFK